MALLLSVGSLYTSTLTGNVYEIVSLTPNVLYSPVRTYNTTIANTRIFQRTPEDFVTRFFEGGSDFTLTFNGQPLGYQQQILTRTPA